MNRDNGLLIFFCAFLAYRAATFTYGAFVDHSIQIGDFQAGMESIGTAIAALMIRSPLHQGEVDTANIEADTANVTEK